jgi:Zn-dependent protease
VPVGVSMHRLVVPFRMHKSGWIMVAACHLIGIRLGGLRAGLAIGAMLVASLLLHEVGHMLTAGVLGTRVREFGLCLVGAYNRRSCANRRRDEILISTAGPVMNLCMVIPLMFVPSIGLQLATFNLVLGLANLLPLPSSDGLHILRIILHSNRNARAIPGLSQPRSIS